ncbi:MAG TPA: FAD binding domain-containing protein [Anaerolineales bacterium]
MWREYLEPKSVDEVLGLLDERGASARLIAGATDLMLELERGIRRGIDTLIDITRINGLSDIRLDSDGVIHLGPLVTHNDCVASALLRERAFPLVRAAWEVGAPQIRNRGTVAGNLITASPANDTITPLIAHQATLSLASVRGVRRVPLKDFYLGVRRTALQPDEMLVDISFPALTASEKGTFLKLALRRAQAISVVNVAVVLGIEGAKVQRAAVALGAVAPTIVRAPEAEDYLIGHSLDEATILRAAEITRDASRPIDDLRGSAAYRREMVRILTARALKAVATGKERDGFPAAPVLLRGSMNGKPKSPSRPVPGGPSRSPSKSPKSEITTIINGKSYSLAPESPKSLLRLLREDAGLTGTKEGCAEGECGACTVFLDGHAVMSCLVPAPREHNAEVITVEGLADGGLLHPVQKAFVQDGAVQCGYCTPGFVMASAKLLEERPVPNRNEIEQALTGNLCRCTGYYKIIKAVEDASREAA